MSAAKKTRITWLGHATVLVQTAQGTNILIDPFMTHNPKYPKEFVLPAKIHYVLLTHGHGDHISDAVPVAGSMAQPWWPFTNWQTMLAARESNADNRHEPGRHGTTG